MSMLCPSPPPAPDYAAAAQTQGQQNRDTAVAESLLNNPNQVGPYGTQQWSGPDDGSGRGTLTTTLSPDQQALLDARTGLQGQGLAALQAGLPNLFNAVTPSFDISGQPMQTFDPGMTPDHGFNYDPRLDQAPSLQTSLDMSGVPGLPTADTGTRDSVVNALYAQQTKMLDPQFASQQAALDSQLANQGITRDSAAYTNAENSLALQKQAAYADAQNRAITGGGDAMAQQFGMGLQANQAGMSNAQAQGNFSNTAHSTAVNDLLNQMTAGNSAVAQGYNVANSQAQLYNSGRAQQVQEAATQRTLPVNLFNSLMTQGQVTNPQFQPYNNNIQWNPAPTFAASQATGQSNLNAYNAQQGTLGNFVNAGSRIGAAYLGS